MTTTYPKHEKAYDYAKHCIGVHESPNGSNRGPIQISNPNGGVDFFETHDFVNGIGYPWCACFWLTCWAMAGHSFPYRSPGAYSIANWAKQRGWTKPVTQLVPGDACVWREGSGHLSMFEKWDPSTGLVHTIDGNWNNQVIRATHKISNLYAGIHVPEQAVVPAPKEPYFVIATSVGGHKKILFSHRATRKKILGILPRLISRYGSSGITIKKSKKKPR